MAQQFSFGDAVVNITGEFAGLNKALLDAKRAVNKNMGEILNVMKTFGTQMTIAGGAITAGLTVAVTKVSELGSNLLNMSHRVGIAVDSLSELKYIAERNGVSFEELTRAFARMQKTLAKGADDEEGGLDKVAGKRQKYAEQMQDLNTRLMRSQRDLNEEMNKSFNSGPFPANLPGAPKKSRHFHSGGKNTREERQRNQDQIEDHISNIAKLHRSMADVQDKVDALDDVTARGAYGQLGLDPDSERARGDPKAFFYDTLKALSQVQNRIEQTALAMKMFGGGPGGAGTSVLAIIGDGLASVVAQEERAKKVGAIWTEKDARLAYNYDNQIRDIKYSLMALLRSAFMPLLPMLTKGADEIVNLVGAGREWISQHKELTQTIIIETGKWGLYLTAMGGLFLILPKIIGFFRILNVILMSPWLLGAALAVIGVVYAWKTNLLGFRNWIVPFLEDIELIFHGHWEHIGLDFDILINLLKQKWTSWKHWQAGIAKDNAGALQEELNQLRAAEPGLKAKAMAPSTGHPIDDSKDALAYLANQARQMILVAQLAKAKRGMANNPADAEQLALMNQYDALVKQKEELNKTKGKTWVGTAAEDAKALKKWLDDAMKSAGNLYNNLTNQQPGQTGGGAPMTWAQKMAPLLPGNWPGDKGGTEFARQYKDGSWGFTDQEHTNANLEKKSANRFRPLDRNAFMQNMWGHIADQNFGKKRGGLGMKTSMDALQEHQDKVRSVEEVNRIKHAREIGKAFGSELRYLIRQFSPADGMAILRLAADAYADGQ